MSVFIRLQGCSAKHACFQSGVVCDTEFESGREMTLDALDSAASAAAGLGDATRPPAPLWIVWTGGEPLDQLTPEVVQWFAARGWRQALETSGVRPFPGEFRRLFDWIACSPKVAEHVLVKHFGEAGLVTLVPAHRVPGTAYTIDVMAHVHELRYVRHVGQNVPVPSLTALTYYLSPHSDGFTINPVNVKHVVGLCAKAPQWRISVQQHKLWSVL